jgi:hypothetical protein
LAGGYIRHGLQVKNAAGLAVSAALRYAAALRGPSCAAVLSRAAGASASGLWVGASPSRWADPFASLAGTDEVPARRSAGGRREE